MHLTAAVDSRPCDVDGCTRDAHPRSRLCAGHAKRIERGQETDTPLRERLTLRERCQDLAIQFAEADSDDDDDFERKWDALEHALRKWSAELRARRGGEARAKALTPKERSDSARHASLSQSPARRAEIARIAAEARAAALSPERRRAIAKKAVQARIAAQRKLGREEG